MTEETPVPDQRGSYATEESLEGRFGYRLRGDRLTVSAGKLIFNDWNPNEQDERTWEAELESIVDHGFLDEVLVRYQNDTGTVPDGHYEMIDGEHRARGVLMIAQDDPEAPIDVRAVHADDAEAQILTVIMNETRGKADKIKLAQLLAKLKNEYGDDLGRGLNMSKSELQELVDLAAHDWQDYGADYVDDSEYPDDAGEWVTLEVTLTAEDHRAFEEASRRVASAQPLTGESPVRSGQVVAALAAEYLGGANG